MSGFSTNDTCEGALNKSNHETAPQSFLAFSLIGVLHAWQGSLLQLLLRETLRISRRFPLFNAARGRLLGRLFLAYNHVHFHLKQTSLLLMRLSACSLAHAAPIAFSSLSFISN